MKHGWRSIRDALKGTCRRRSSRLSSFLLELTYCRLSSVARFEHMSEVDGCVCSSLFAFLLPHLTFSLTSLSPLSLSPRRVSPSPQTGRSRASPTHRLQRFPTPCFPSYPLSSPRRSNERVHLPRSNLAEEGRWRRRFDLLQDRQQRRDRCSCEGWEVEGFG